MSSTYSGNIDYKLDLIVETAYISYKIHVANLPHTFGK